MSLEFGLDLPAIEVRVCPNTDKALAYLSRCHASCEELMAIELETHNLEYTLWVHGSPKYKKPQDVNTVIDQIIADTRSRWSKFLSHSLQQFDEAATINAQFLLGDPWFPPRCQ